MLEHASLLILLSLSSHHSDPVFSRSHAQPDVDLSRPPELHLHHQSNLSVPTGRIGDLPPEINNNLKLRRENKPLQLEVEHRSKLIVTK